MSRRNTFVDAMLNQWRTKSRQKVSTKEHFCLGDERVNLILPLSYHQILVKRLLDIKKNTNVRGSHGHPVALS